MAASRPWYRPGCLSRARTVRRSAFLHLLAAGLLLAVSVIGAKAAGFPAGFTLGTFLVYALLAAFVAAFVGDHAPHARFGAANELTLLRGAVACLLGGLVAVAPQVDPHVLWWAAAVGFGALALDGLDGAVARRRGEASRFGASFDLETDSLLILLLSILMYRLDRAGLWVLAVGLLRYAFVAAGWIWPRLAAPLRTSFRRKVVCVLQVVVLVSCIPPALPPEVTRPVLAGALALLVASFAADAISLLRRRHAARQEASLARQILPPRR